MQASFKKNSLKISKSNRSQAIMEKVVQKSIKIQKSGRGDQALYERYE
jgi:hypothetical protein